MRNASVSRAQPCATTSTYCPRSLAPSACIDVCAHVCSHGQFRKSSLLRSPEEITINPKNGDMVLPDKTKANAFTNIQPVLDYMKKLNGVEVEEGDSPAAATKYADVGANPSATAPAAKPSGSDEAKSPAGKIAVGGWMMASAAALAAAAVVIV